MITARFSLQGGKVSSFDISGHSGYSDAGSDIVCAAVSSAVSLCECAITEIIGADTEISVDESSARVTLKLCDGLSNLKRKACGQMLDALLLHMVALRDEYPKFIEVLEV